MSHEHRDVFEIQGHPCVGLFLDPELARDWRPLVGPRSPLIARRVRVLPTWASPGLPGTSIPTRIVAPFGAKARHLRRLHRLQGATEARLAAQVRWLEQDGGLPSFAAIGEAAGAYHRMRRIHLGWARRHRRRADRLTLEAENSRPMHERLGASYAEAPPGTFHGD